MSFKTLTGIHSDKLFQIWRSPLDCCLWYSQSYLSFKLTLILSHFSPELHFSATSWNRIYVKISHIKYRNLPTLPSLSAIVVCPPLPVPEEMSLRIVKNNQCSLVGLTAHLLRGGGGWSLMSVYPVVRTLCLLLYLAGVIFCPPVTGGILVGKISNIFLAQLMCSAKLIVSAHTHSCQEPIDSEQNMIDHWLKSSAFLLSPSQNPCKFPPWMAPGVQEK